MTASNSLFIIFDYLSYMKSSSDSTWYMEVDWTHLQFACICVQRNRYTSTLLLHQLCNINKLNDRRNMHLNLFMFKQKSNLNIVNTRKVYTRAHDVILFKTIKPNNEKYKRNVYYNGAILWNNLPVGERNVEVYDKFKTVQKQKILDLL